MKSRLYYIFVVLLFCVVFFLLWLFCCILVVVLCPQCFLKSVSLSNSRDNSGVGAALQMDAARQSYIWLLGPLCVPLLSARLS